MRCGAPETEGVGTALRRSMSDALNEETQDENVRDAAGGWRQGSGTRQSVYNDEQDPHLIARTRHAVLAARHTVLGTDPALESLRQQVVQLAWGADHQSLTEALEALRRPKLTPQLTPGGVWKVPNRSPAQPKAKRDNGLSQRARQYSNLRPHAPEACALSN